MKFGSWMVITECYNNECRKKKKITKEKKKPMSHFRRKNMKTLDRTMKSFIFFLFFVDEFSRVMTFFLNIL